MNKQKIQEALDTLTAAINEDDDQVILKWTGTKRELKVLRRICRMDISVPKVVNKDYSNTPKIEVCKVLHRLGDAIDRIAP